MTQLAENKQPAPFLIASHSPFFVRRIPSDPCTVPGSTNKYSSLPITTYALLVPTSRAAVKWSAAERADKTQ